MLPTGVPSLRRSVTEVTTVLEPLQKNVATIASPWCGFRGPNLASSIRPLSPRTPFSVSRTMPPTDAAPQLTGAEAVAVPPEGTETLCGFAVVTVQLLATPATATLCVPAGRLLKVTLALIPTGWLVVPSTVTV